MFQSIFGSTKLEEEIVHINIDGTTNETEKVTNISDSEPELLENPVEEPFEEPIEEKHKTTLSEDPEIPIIDFKPIVYTKITKLTDDTTGYFEYTGLYRSLTFIVKLNMKYIGYIEKGLFNGTGRLTSDGGKIDMCGIFEDHYLIEGVKTFYDIIYIGTFGDNNQLNDNNGIIKYHKENRTFRGRVVQGSPDYNNGVVTFDRDQETLDKFNIEEFTGEFDEDAIIDVMNSETTIVILNKSKDTIFRIDTSTWCDTLKYVGHVKYGLYNGPGVYTDTSNTSQKKSGYFLNNSLVKGTYTTEEKTCIGLFTNEKLDDPNGVIKYTNGDVFTGLVKKGNPVLDQGVMKKETYTIERVENISLEDIEKYREAIFNADKEGSEYHKMQKINTLITDKSLCGKYNVKYSNYQGVFSSIWNRYAGNINHGIYHRICYHYNDNLPHDIWKGYVGDIKNGIYHGIGYLYNDNNYLFGVWVDNNFVKGYMKVIKEDIEYSGKFITETMGLPRNVKFTDDCGTIKFNKQKVTYMGNVDNYNTGNIGKISLEKRKITYLGAEGTIHTNFDDQYTIISLPNVYINCTISPPSLIDSNPWCVITSIEGVYTNDGSCLVDNISSFISLNNNILTSKSLIFTIKGDFVFPEDFTRDDFNKWDMFTLLLFLHSMFDFSLMFYMNMMKTTKEEFNEMKEQQLIDIGLKSVDVLKLNIKLRKYGITF